MPDPKKEVKKEADSKMETVESDGESPLTFHHINVDLDDKKSSGKKNRSQAELEILDLVKDAIDSGNSKLALEIIAERKRFLAMANEVGFKPVQKAAKLHALGLTADDITLINQAKQLTLQSSTTRNRGRQGRKKYNSSRSDPRKDRTRSKSRDGRKNPQ